MVSLIQVQIFFHNDTTGLHEVAACHKKFYVIIHSFQKIHQTTFNTTFDAILMPTFQGSIFLQAKVQIVVTEEKDDEVAKNYENVKL